MDSLRAGYGRQRGTNEQAKVDNMTANAIDTAGEVKASLGAPWHRTMAGADAASVDVEGELGYILAPEARAYTYMYDPPEGVARENFVYAPSFAAIRDARGSGADHSIHREGYELWDAPTHMTDFRDERQVSEIYYPEIQALVREVLGVRAVMVFDHQVRKREAGRPALTFGRHGDGKSPAAVGRVHNDYTESSAQRRLQLVLGDQASSVRHFGILNVWRSIAGPVLDTPLAVCDARTIREGELVPAEIRYQERTGEIYLSRRSQAHKWSYFSRMDRGEALIFKQFDSRTDVSRFSLHSAFDLPDTPKNAPLRESIEVRCLFVYE
jgi:hypothetical protein